MGRNASHHSQSPTRGRGSPPSRRHRRDSSPVREKRTMSRSPSPPTRPRSSQKESEKSSGRRDERSRSLSPRTKRLRRAQLEREGEKGEDRDYEKDHRKVDGKKVARREREREDEKSHAKGVGDKGMHRERDGEREHDRERGRGGGSERSVHRERGGERESGIERKGRRPGRDESDRNSHRERGGDRENGGEKRERRSARDEGDEKSSRARNGGSESPSDRHYRSRHRSRSPQLADASRERQEVTDTRGAERRDDDDEDDSLAKMKAAEEALETNQKHKPSFELSGKLAAETNRVRGVTLLFTEPPDARKPDVRWRLYVFKGGEVLNEPLYIHRQSCYLFGRERRVADIPTDHPSCSKQHAVIQFRQVEKEQPDGTLSKQVRPYLMDLGSTNKTFINDNPLEPQRYYELLEKDTIKFGNSSREYVLLHENSAE